ncbi:MAG TPA: winged helix-turn-helix domain-containing protein [Thermodesulfovibrio thiophilus]|uniref:winged helix-turn-helix domain-containing protein n=1 Tax=Thermodesulfovibrio thiophilus TaxID=340095 RepID=UPI00041C63C5|nr:winged helix-turn-helix domain-containing protein [Thermodesulfovibrio thiophilus]HHW20776.1 LysR family transcriptional regulator [Thermodesulfovibrio thiophilus]HQA04438.1 winged helix-turn-helix domain-containing protein [Thermodesulfovibrio thiophilus]
MKKSGRKGLKDLHQSCIIGSDIHKNYTLKGKFWIEGHEGTFLGYGRIALLERIKQYGSISKAAKSMNMSYRHAWRLITSMNRQAGKPFIETHVGGKDGGGTILTEAGERAIEQFWSIHKSLKKFFSEKIKKFDV